MQKEIILDPNDGWYVPAQEKNEQTGTTVLYDDNGDPVDVVTSPKGLTAEAITAPNTPSGVTQYTVEPPSHWDQAKRGLGLGTRDMFQGSGSLVDVLAGPVNALINALPGEQGMSTSPFRDLASYLSDELGLPVSETDAEKLMSAFNEGGIQGLLTFGGGTALQGAKGTAGVVGSALASAPVTEVAASAIGNASGELARQNDAGPFGQIMAMLAGGGLSAVAISRIEQRLKTQTLQNAFDSGKSTEDLMTLGAELEINPELDALTKAVMYRDEGGTGAKIAPPSPATVDADGNIVPMQAANDTETFQVNEPTDDQVDTLLDNLDEARTQEPRPAREAGEEATYDGNINLDRFKTAKNVQNEWETVVGEINKMLPERTVQTQEATKSLARRLGVDMAELLKKNPTLEEAPQYALALENSLLEANKRIVTKAQNRPNWTDTDRDEFVEDVMLAAFIQDKAVKARTQTGRALNAYNIMRRGGPKYRRTIEELNPMFKRENADRLADMILAHPDKADKIARDAMGRRAEDYLFSFMYNMMLSNPATHTVNFVGTGSHVGLDLFTKGVASVGGQFKRPLKGTDRVYGREVLARMNGIVNAFLDSNNYKKAAQSYVEGVPVDRIAEVEVSSPVLPKPASMVLGYPTRLLAAGDELWRGIIQSSSFYGEATRLAIKEGLKGDALKARVNELVENPTENMKDIAVDYARKLQFLDDSSPIARGVQYLKSKKQIENPVQDAIVRTGQTMLRMIVPFDRTPDALIRSALRNSPLGLVDRYNLDGLWKGGASRDEAVARMMVGTGLTYSLVEMVNDGLITGSGPEDYEKRVKMEDSGWQANSVYIPGQGYVSYEGLEPLSIIFNVVSSLTEQSNDEERAEKDIDDQIAGLIADLGTALSDNTFTESIGNFLQMFSDGPQGESARNNFVAGLASSLTTPAIVRNYNQTQNDEAVRVTTGDGSISDRVVGRVAAGWPGASEQLPQRHDAYGRPMEQKDRLGPDMFTRAKVTPDEENLTVLEINRIGGLARVDKGDIDKFKADAEQVQAYQKLSGEYITETVNQMMESGEWGALTDEEKKKELKSIVKDMREIARETLFPDYYGENAEIELDPSEGWSTEPQ